MPRQGATESVYEDVDTAKAAPWANDAHPWVELFGMHINTLSLDAFFAAVDDRIAARAPGYVVTPNVDHVCTFEADPQLVDAYRGCFLAVPDSTPLMWASRLLRRPLMQKLSGSDLIYWLSGHAARRGHKVFLLGAEEGIAEKAGETLRQRYPGLDVCGVLSPPFGFEKDPEALGRVLRTLNDARPDICFVALGSPKQEIWMQANTSRSGVPVMLGVGASLDFVAGKVRRAPRLLQKTGLEWVWRLCKEPRRLWRRYLVKDMRFLALVGKAVWQELKTRA